jgi:hypothetical protein
LEGEVNSTCDLSAPPGGDGLAAMPFSLSHAQGGGGAEEPRKRLNFPGICQADELLDDGLFGLGHGDRLVLSDAGRCGYK